MTERVQEELVPEARGEVQGRGRLVGRRILVLGGGQISFGVDDKPYGNGRAMSILFGREGASVVVVDIDEKSANETVRLVQQEGVAAYALTCDVSNEKDVKEKFQKACKLLGGLDGIVMNVGISQGKLLENTSVEDWDHVFAVNVRSSFMCCKYGLPLLDKGGSIVMISSIAANVPSTERPSYSASKAALNGLCLHAAREGAPKQIRCNIIVPGLIDTPRGRRGSKLQASRDQISIPLGRQGTSWEVAYTAVFLLSNESSYITGQSLVVDGGLLAIR